MSPNLVFKVQVKNITALPLAWHLFVYCKLLTIHLFAQNC